MIQSLDLDDVDGVSLMGWFAAVPSKAMVRPLLGKGSVDMGPSAAAMGNGLRRQELPGASAGGVPPGTSGRSPFYDVWTRSLLANGHPEASKNSYNPAVAVNDNGFLDLFFGPEPPTEGHNVDHR